MGLATAAFSAWLVYLVPPLAGAEWLLVTIIALAVASGCLLIWGGVGAVRDTRRSLKAKTGDQALRRLEVQAEVARVRAEIDRHIYWRSVADDYGDHARVSQIDASVERLRFEEARLVHRLESPASDQGRSPAAEPFQLRTYIRDFWDKPAGKWVIGTAAVAAVLVSLISGNLGAPGGDRDEAVGGPATSIAPSPSDSPELSCLAYNGEDSELFAYSEYEESDFIPVRCTEPHQYEVVAREDDVACDDAITELTQRHSFSGFNRIVEAPYGPDTCAFGRQEGHKLQTDTYRLSSTSDPLSAFGSCMDEADIDSFLSGESYDGEAPCYSGRVLGWYVSIAAEAEAEQRCAEAADDIPNKGFRWAYAPTSSQSPAARCAFILWGVGES